MRRVIHLLEIFFRNLNNILAIGTAQLLTQLPQKERQQQISQIIRWRFFVRFIGAEHSNDADQTCTILEQTHTFLDFCLNDQTNYSIFFHSIFRLNVRNTILRSSVAGRETHLKFGTIRWIIACFETIVQIKGFFKDFM